MSFLHFMERPIGRSLRAFAGVALIAIGLALGGGWLALAAVGLVPLAAGAFNFCLLAPLFHEPLHPAKS